MAQEETRYKPKEIAAATGMKIGTLRTRRARLGIPSNKKGYTLEEVKRIIKKPPARQFSQQKANQLRQQLRNDGAIPY